MGAGAIPMIGLGALIVSENGWPTNEYLTIGHMMSIASVVSAVITLICFGFVKIEWRFMVGIIYILTALIAAVCFDAMYSDEIEHKYMLHFNSMPTNIRVQNTVMVEEGKAVDSKYGTGFKRVDRDPFMS